MKKKYNLSIVPQLSSINITIKLEVRGHQQKTFVMVSGFWLLRGGGGIE